MRKLILILLLAASACSSVENRQQRAERTVKEYIHYKNPKAILKNIKFTDLDPNSNVIGIVENKVVYDNTHHPVLIRTLYYALNKDLTRVISVYTY
jgi:hypothetical protein